MFLVAGFLRPSVNKESYSLQKKCSVLKSFLFNFMEGANNQSDSSPSAASPPERSTTERTERSVYKLPAVKFLTRPDFFPMLQANEVKSGK